MITTACAPANNGNEEHNDYHKEYHDPHICCDIGFQDHHNDCDGYECHNDNDSCDDTPANTGRSNVSTTKVTKVMTTKV